MDSPPELRGGYWLAVHSDPAMDGTYAHRGPCSSVSWFKTGSDQAFVTEKVSSFLSDSGHASSDEASSDTASVTTTTSGLGAATPRDAAKPSRRRRKQNEIPTAVSVTSRMSNSTLEKLNTSLAKLTASKDIEIAVTRVMKQSENENNDNTPAASNPRPSLDRALERIDELVSLDKEIIEEAEKVIDVGETTLNVMNKDLESGDFVKVTKKRSKKKKSDNPVSTHDTTPDKPGVVRKSEASQDDPILKIAIGFSKIKTVYYRP